MPVTLVAMALGFLISVQFQTQKGVSAAEQINEDRMSQMKSVLSNSQEKNISLHKEHSVLMKQLDVARKTVGVSPKLLAELNKFEILCGKQAVSGSGIHITIDDRESPFPLFSDDIATMINVLKFARAEAISLNGQRIVGSTAIVLSGSSNIVVNQVPINVTSETPYEINAIGNQDTLYDYFSKLIGVTLKESGMTVSIVKKTVSIPSYKGEYTFKNTVPLVP